MQNKKAILLPEILRIVLAVMCIGLLIYLGVGLYNIMVADKEIQQAKAGLSAIEGKIKDLQSKAVDGTQEYLLLGPRDWSLTGWPYEEYKIAFCEQNGWEKCLCMCKMDMSLWGRITQKNSRPSAIKEKCEEDRICIKIEAENFKVNPISGSDLFPINIKKINEDFKGALVISYEKESSTLTIAPKQNE